MILLMYITTYIISPQPFQNRFFKQPVVGSEWECGNRPSGLPSTVLHQVQCHVLYINVII